MNPYKKLKLELDGIRDVITQYSSSVNVNNFINGLDIALKEDNYEEMLYYLNQLCIWYKNNINEIHSNEFVFNSDDHDRNKKILEELNDQLKSYDFSNYINVAEKQDNSPKIFISHKSSDKKYGDALRDLIISLGVSNEQLIYTSHPLHKIPLDKNIYDYLKDNINSNVFVIILWSNEYLDSPACLNEMGAAWVAQTDYTNIYTPNFSFENPKYNECVVDTKKMGAVLNGDAYCKANMIEFKNKILDIFNLEIDEQTWSFNFDKFIEAIQKN